jgi:hypothetical protein
MVQRGRVRIDRKKYFFQSIGIWYLDLNLYVHVNKTSIHFVTQSLEIKFYLQYKNLNIVKGRW